MATTTAMTATTTDTEAATRLQLMWLASPALPVGGFSYSEGLEAAVDAGLVHNEAGATRWLAEHMPLVLARSDAALMAEACRAWAAADTDAVRALNEWVSQTRETAESRLQSEQMGRSLFEWLKNSLHARDPRVPQLAALTPAPTWPVAFALAATLAGATPRDALLAFAWGWAENMAQAAMKAVPLGQAAAQRMLSVLAGHIPALVDTALATPPEHRQAFAPGLAILSARHETQYSRLFRS